MSTVRVGRFHGASSAINAGNAMWGGVGDRGDQAGRMSTDTAVCKYNAGPAHLALYTAQTGAATATVTGNTVTGAVARGRRRHHEGGGTAELFYQWARAAPRVTPRSVTPTQRAELTSYDF